MNRDEAAALGATPPMQAPGCSARCRHTMQADHATAQGWLRWQLGPWPGTAYPMPGHRLQPHGQQGPVMWTPSLGRLGLHDALHPFCWATCYAKLARCSPSTFCVRVARMMISVRMGVTRTSTPE